MSFEEVAGKLLEEPYGMTFEQIADLTSYQLVNILGRKRECERSPTATSSPEGIKAKVRAARIRAGLPPDPV